ncbi:transcriptional repressor [Paraburkholderia sp. BR10872]|uniref:transcriptional repressor n=1 Tax=Paraburkholderia sp. BR10872 TaxID=3236989 RepID=UPI0034D26CCD
MRAVSYELARARLSAGSGRVAVLTAFYECPREHTTAEQVFRRPSAGADRCSQASVYRALSSLLEAGLISNAWVGETRVVYELNRGAPQWKLMAST